MIVEVHNSHILIGVGRTTEQAINLPHVDAEQATFTLDNDTYVSGLCGAIKSSPNEDKATRCIALIKQLLLQRQDSGDDSAFEAPIFWLLPEFDEQHGEASKHFVHFAKQLQQALPGLFTHAQSQFFPFGRAAFPVALAAAIKLLEQSDINTVSFIGVDSLLPQLAELVADNALVTASSEQGVVPAEGAIFSQITCAAVGVSVDFIHSLVAPSKHRTLTVKALFKSGCEHLTTRYEQQATQGVFSHLYLPGNGREDLQQSWLDAYFQLSGCIGADTCICQSAFFTGELGSVTGLYNFLHIVNGYEHKNLQGNVLQLEVSDTLHQGISVYSWVTA